MGRLSICLLLTFLTVASEVGASSIEIVDLNSIESDVVVDMMYASNDNFLGRRVTGYAENVCLLTKPAAEALKLAHARLQQEGKKAKKTYRFLIRDCYRPEKAVADFMAWVKSPTDLAVQKKYFPGLTKKDLVSKGYIAPISGHSRASSVDLTILEISPDSGKPPRELNMGTRLDFFGELSHTGSKGIGNNAKAHRELLQRVMQPDFVNYKKEWWHFALKNEPNKKLRFDFDVNRASVTSAAVSAEATAGIYKNQRRLADSALVVDDADILDVLDSGQKSPLSLGVVFDGILKEHGLAPPNFAGVGSLSAHQLMSYKSTYGSIFTSLDQDIKSIIKEMGIDWEHDITKTYQPQAAKTADGKRFRLNGNVMRVFDQNWLKSKNARFQLVGIVNRIDRRDFSLGETDCGETRLIYRLAYVVNKNGKLSSSRLPFTFNVVYTNNNDGSSCRETAESWQEWYAPRLSKNDLVKRLLAGPLDPDRMKFKQFEVNAQIARFPSDLERQESRHFAGQAVYWMRIFAMRSGAFTPVKLENTPDVALLRKDEKKRQKLATVIVENLKDIDQGGFQLPKEYLTDLALSWSTQGSARTANRPWDLIFTREDAGAMITKATGAVGKNGKAQFVVDGASLLERLNTSTCMGCHQSASTAGFHFLGQDRFDIEDPGKVRIATDGNRLALSYSPHVSSELARRRTYISILAAGKEPDSFREHPARPAITIDKRGALPDMPCLLSDGLGDRAQWQCDRKQGVTCVDIVKNPKASFRLGACSAGQKRITAGNVCRRYEIADHTGLQLSTVEKQKRRMTSWNVLSFRDQVVSDIQLYRLSEGKLDAESQNCRPTRIGVPLGRVTRNCRSSEKAMSHFASGKDRSVPVEFCAVVGGKGFEEMAKGFFDSRVFAQGVSRGMLNTCSIERECREDYICQELPDFLTSERFGIDRSVISRLQQQRIGFCTPTYFVYQLRLDGHPIP